MKIVLTLHFIIHTNHIQTHHLFTAHSIYCESLDSIQSNKIFSIFQCITQTEIQFTADEYLFENQWGGISLLNVLVLAERVLMSNTTFVSTRDSKTMKCAICFFCTENHCSFIRRSFII